MQEQEDKGKKAGKKGLFELSLCAKQLPGLPGRERRTALCSFTCRPIVDTLYRGNRRKCRSSFSPIVSSLVIERSDGRENERMENGAIIWNLDFEIRSIKGRF